MPKRGAKPRTESNSRPDTSGAIDWSEFPEPEMTEGASAEFRRLIGVLREKGTLEKTDPSVVVNLARLTDLLDKAHESLGEVPDLTTCTDKGNVVVNPLISVINSLTIRRRGLLNDLGLTPASSRYSRSAHGGEDKASRWKGLLKVTG